MEAAMLDSNPQQQRHQAFFIDPNRSISLGPSTARIPPATVVLPRTHIPKQLSRLSTSRSSFLESRLREQSLKAACCVSSRDLSCMWAEEPCIKISLCDAHIVRSGTKVTPQVCDIAKLKDEEGFSTGSSAKTNRGWLHVADLLPHAEIRYKQTRSGLDLPNKQRKRQDPNAQELWLAKYYPIQGEVTEGAIRQDDRLNTEMRRIDPISPIAASTSDLRFQIFIKPPSGKSTPIWIQASDKVSKLKKIIANHIGIPEGHQHLLSEGRSIQDHWAIGHYNIKPGSNIIINMRLRGGAAASGSQTPGSFRDAVKGKGKMPTKPQSPPEQPGPHMVDQKLEYHMLKVTIPEVNALHSELSKHAVICRFNGYWPKSDALHQWVYFRWTPECDIYLCSKGFFIVNFHTEEERDSIIKEGPWFWGNAGLFITPWFADFDANTMKISTTPVWVKLQNLPLHFWHHIVLSAIGDSLGKFLKIDEDRYSRGIFTFARLCVEVDLSQRLPDKISLNYNNTEWIQPLDYENTAFRCRSYRQTGHLQNSCPLARKNPKGNKKQQKKPNGWQNIKPLEEENIQTEHTVNQEEPDINMEQNGTQEKKAPDPQMEDHSQQQKIPQLEVSGNKRTHGSKGSESDKKPSVNTQEYQQAIIVPPSDSQGWRRVEKKKGRKV